MARPIQGRRRGGLNDRYRLRALDRPLEEQAFKVWPDDGLIIGLPFLAPAWRCLGTEPIAVGLEPWPGRRAIHGAIARQEIALAGKLPSPTLIGFSAVLVAVLIGVTVPERGLAT
jgi:hypothetical protein